MCIICTRTGYCRLPVHRTLHLVIRRRIIRRPTAHRVRVLILLLLLPSGRRRRHCDVIVACSTAAATGCDDACSSWNVVCIDVDLVLIDDVTVGELDVVLGHEADMSRIVSRLTNRKYIVS